MQNDLNWIADNNILALVFLELPKLQEVNAVAQYGKTWSTTDRLVRMTMMRTDGTFMGPNWKGKVSQILKFILFLIFEKQRLIKKYR